VKWRSSFIVEVRIVADLVISQLAAVAGVPVKVHAVCVDLSKDVLD